MISNNDIIDIRRRAFEEAAQIARDMADQNRASAIKLHVRSSRQAKIYGNEDAADQTKISAQVLDACAEEARCIAERILARAPKVTA